MSETRRVVLLASYCGNDDPTCSSEVPCDECLRMCNIVEITGTIRQNFGGWDYNRELAKRRHATIEQIKMGLPNA